LKIDFELETRENNKNASVQRAQANETCVAENDVLTRTKYTIKNKYYRLIKKY